MITNIKTKGLHGPDISQPCSKKMMFYGPNRSNKTTRTNIIHLCLNGFISSAHRVCKKPVDILNQYAKGDFLTSAIEINETEFEFHISRDSKGKTSRRFRIDKKKYSEKEYMTELALSGNPKIIDLESFIQMSDAKKIDQLFKLYPAKVDIKKLNSDIEKKNAKISRYKADIETKKAVIRENEKSKQLIELPAGTLADIKDELENHRIAYQGTRDKITEIKAKEKAKQEMVVESEKNVGLVKEDFLTEQQSNAIYNQEAPVPGGTFPGIDEKQSNTELELINAKQDCVISLQKILKSMNDSGCSMCVAAMVCKKEIREAKNA